MCGGFSIISKKKTIIERFRAEFTYDYKPLYNARPGQKLPVILNQGNTPRKISLAHFGFLPHWLAKPAKFVINARAETIYSKPFFKDSLLHRRCLIIADSFFEWKPGPKGRQPYRILLKTEEPFAFAGIWDEIPGAPPSGLSPVQGFAIITVPANSDVEPIHARMPAILKPEEEQLWLNPGIGQADVLRLIHPLEEGLIKSYPISKLVNSPINDTPDVIKSLD